MTPRPWDESIELDEDGAVLVRRATEPDARAALVHAADVLRSVTHPGGESLVDLDVGGHATVLRVMAPGERSLSTHPPRSARRLAGLAAGIAQVVDDLHGCGVAHGPIAPGQVVLAGRDRPILMDFSSGTRRGSMDDLAWSAHVADDEWAILDLVEGLIDELPSLASSAIGERVQRHRLARLTEHLRTTRDGVASLATRYAAFAGSTRADRVGRHRRTVRPAGTRRAGRRHRSRSLAGQKPPPRTRHLVPLLLTVVGIGLITSGIIGLMGGHPSPPGGTSHRVAVAGRTLTVDGSRFVVGRPGDVVCIGDWTGTGASTPALLRPSTGEVFVFDRWPSPGGPITTSARATVRGARTLRVVRHRDAPASLSVIRRSGPPVPIDPAPARPQGSTP